MELSASEKLWRRMGLRLLLFALLAVFVLGAIPFLLQLFLPFLLAFWVAMGLNPLICQLETRVCWKRSVIVLFLLSLVAGVVLSFFWLVIPALVSELSTLTKNWEPLMEELWLVGEELVERLEVFLKRELIFGESLDIQRLKEWLFALLSRFFVAVGDWVMKVPQYVVGCLVFFMATYFMAIDYPLYQGKMRQHTTRKWRWWAEEMKETAVQAFGGYLKAQVILTLGVGGIMVLGFFFMELPFALVLALSIALLDFIPMIGAGMVLLPWAMVAFFTNQREVAWQLGVIWLLTALFRRLLEPKVLGQQTGLSPLLSLVSIYVGLQLGGLWGMILAPVVLLMLLHILALGIFRGTLEDGKACIRELRGIFEENEEKS